MLSGGGDNREKGAEMKVVLLFSSTTLKLSTGHQKSHASPRHKHTQRLTQQWRYAFRDGVGHTQRQQQDTDDRGSQPSHNEMEVNVSDTVSIHLWQREGSSILFVYNNGLPQQNLN